MTAPRTEADQSPTERTMARIKAEWRAEWEAERAVAAHPAGTCVPAERMATAVALVRFGFLVMVGGKRSEPKDIIGEPYRGMLEAILSAPDTDAAILAALAQPAQEAPTNG